MNKNSIEKIRADYSTPSSNNDCYRDDIATPEEIKAIEEGMKEFAEGKTISHEDIDWE